MERIQQDPRLTANRSKSVNSSIAEAGGAWSYIGHNAAQGVDNSDTSWCGAGAPPACQRGVIPPRITYVPPNVTYFFLLLSFSASALASSSILSMRRAWASGVL